MDGADRYVTARNIAERPGLGAAGTADYDGTPADPDGTACLPRKTAILATGENFPDALVAGPVAFNGHNVPGGGSAVPPGTPGCGDGQGFPVILTTGASLHPQAAAALTNLGIQQVLVMGGNVAVAPAVVTAVQAINSITVQRFDGATRLDTAKRFAEFAIDFLGYNRTVVSVAVGNNFPDALAGGPHAGTTPANAIVLTETPTSVGAETLAFFRDRQGVSGVFGAPTPLEPILGIDVYGGPIAVSDAAVASILGAISQA
ncbi:MAG TPA: cell wall-binding repeat-containing protein [Acidimicrobiales bacterium]|nr:cell wall-binding repeat-containing protein [Acidimicrobiales bacterium]